MKTSFAVMGKEWTVRRMTDNEIIKALEIHINEFNKTGISVDNNRLDKLTLELINRQKAEIEKLKGSTIVSNIMESQRIKREAKSEAIKEFAERLKNKIKTECNPYGKPTFDYDTSLAIMRYIDNLVKEIVGETDD